MIFVFFAKFEVTSSSVQNIDACQNMKKY